ncbi:hypothetical protein M3Y96_00551800 [Aphelenchoides besseyi]|nr:hypothetical protein M3Y96_00551800 [Aphelenchoides besseyi]
MLTEFDILSPPPSVKPTNLDDDIEPIQSPLLRESEEPSITEFESFSQCLDANGMEEDSEIEFLLKADTVLTDLISKIAAMNAIAVVGIGGIRFDRTKTNYTLTITSSACCQLLELTNKKKNAKNEVESTNILFDSAKSSKRLRSLRRVIMKCFGCGLRQNPRKLHVKSSHDDDERS